MAYSSESTPAETLIGATTAKPPNCEFELQVFSKYDEKAVEAHGPTLAIAVSHTLPQLRYLAHSRAVFGARRQPNGRRSYGSWEIIWPDEEDRPATGYEQFAVRQPFTFDDELEVFDVFSEFDEWEGLLRFRAQDLGDDEKSLKIIADGVREYIDAARQVMLWDPKTKLDIEEGLDDLFLDRDWTQFVSRDDLQTPAVAISDVTLIAKLDDDKWLVRFHYVNDTESGHELEFADVKKGRLKIRRDAYSALRSPIPAFRGDQLPQVYEALQQAIDALGEKSVDC